MCKHCKQCLCKSTVEVSNTDWRVECANRYEEQVAIDELFRELQERANARA